MSKCKAVYIGTEDGPVKVLDAEQGILDWQLFAKVYEAVVCFYIDALGNEVILDGDELRTINHPWPRRMPL